MDLVKYIQAQNATILSAPFVSYQNLNDDFTSCNEIVEIEVGFPVDQLLIENNQIKSYVLESYKAVNTLFTGNYDDLTPVYVEMAQKIKSVDGTFQHLSYEYYLSDEEVSIDQQKNNC